MTEPSDREYWRSPMEELAQQEASLGAQADSTIGTPGEDTSTWDGQQSYDDTCAIRCQEFVLEQFTGMEVDETGLVQAAANGWYTPGFTMTATQDPALSTLPEMSNFDYEAGHVPMVLGMPYDQLTQFEQIVNDDEHPAESGIGTTSSYDTGYYAPVEQSWDAHYQEYGEYYQSWGDYETEMAEYDAYWDDYPGAKDYAYTDTSSDYSSTDYTDTSDY